MKKLSKLNIATIFAIPTSLCMTAGIVGALTSCNGTYKNPNPHVAAESQDVIDTLESIKRIDDKGYLYYMENTEDYNNNTKLLALIIAAEQLLKNSNEPLVDACSAFSAQDFDGTMLTGRAYDFPHSNEGETETTGLNCMIHTPKNEEIGVLHESIGTADAHLVGGKLSEDNLYNGSLDNGTTDISWMSMLPYMTTDGMNDAGLTCSLVLLPNDTEITSEFKRTEPAIATETVYTVTKPESYVLEVSIPRMVRIALDTCSNIAEVTELFKTTWSNRLIGSNFHVFVTEASGKSALIELYDENPDDDTQSLMVIDTDVATNFYQRYSNARSGMPQLTGLKKQDYYHYGYSRDNYRNTYDRFNTIVSMLDFYTPTTKPSDKPWNAIMHEKTVDALLRAVSLYPSPEAGTDSQTQYSCLYNATNLTQKIYSYADLSHSWTYSLKEHKFI